MTSPLKVLVVGHSLINNLNRHKVDCLAQEADLDIQLVVPHRWTGSHGEEYTAKTEEPAYPVHHLRVFMRGKNRQHSYFFGSGLGPCLDRFRPELIHIEEEPYSLVTFQLAWAATRRKKPFVLTTFQNINKRFPPPFCWTERFVLRRAAAALVGSPSMEEPLRSKGFAGIFAPAALGVDPEIYQPVANPELRAQLGVRGFVVGYVGRLQAQKGISTLLRAVAGLKVHLLVVGSGPDEHDLRAEARELGIAEQTSWIPAVSHREVPRYFNTMDACVLPSITTRGLTEQFGRVLIEAMACGVPVVGSSSGGIPAVIGDAGLVFPEGDVGALTRALTRLTDPAERERLSKAGRERVMTHFTWPVIARRIADVYRRVAR